MTRRHIPIAPQVYQETPIVVGALPTHDTHHRYGTDALRGLVMAGSLAAVVPIAKPYAGQGLVSPTFPLVQPSSVAPNAIRTVLVTFLNMYSPSGHSKARGTDEAFPALQPDPNDVGWTMPKKANRSESQGTIPAPPGVPNFPLFMSRVMR